MLEIIDTDQNDESPIVSEEGILTISETDSGNVATEDESTVIDSNNQDFLKK